MKIVVTSILVDNQAKALAFYHYVLGFEPKQDIPMGDHRWLTLTSPNDPNGVELLLEAYDSEQAQANHARLKKAGTPATSFAVRDIQAEYARLCAAGVQFTQHPTTKGAVTVAVFDDTCGNLIQIAQKH